MERPILFTGPMVRAIIAGKKTVTRRIVGKLPSGLPPNCYIGRNEERWTFTAGDRGGDAYGVRCPYGVPGDRLWVREGFAPRYFDDGRPAYMADWTGDSADVTPRPKFKPGIHMPRAASRIDLENLSVRCERLQDITEADVIAEGFRCARIQDARHPSRGPLIDAFANGWDAIKRAPWASNPWVWRVEFRRLEASAS